MRVSPSNDAGFHAEHAQRCCACSRPAGPAAALPRAPGGPRSWTAGHIHVSRPCGASGKAHRHPRRHQAAPARPDHRVRPMHTQHAHTACICSMRSEHAVGTTASRTLSCAWLARRVSQQDVGVVQSELVCASSCFTACLHSERHKSPAVVLIILFWNSSCVCVHCCVHCWDSSCGCRVGEVIERVGHGLQQVDEARELRMHELDRF
jgi:hypothetical protein